MVTTSTPLIAGPSTMRAFSGTAISRLASLSCSRGTSWGMIPAIAGMPAAVAVPLSAASTAICHSCAVSVMTRAAIASWLAAETTLVACMTSVRPNRSASTPPASRKITIGML